MDKGLSGLSLILTAVAVTFVVFAIRDLRTEITQLQRCVYHQECPK